MTDLEMKEILTERCKKARELYKIFEYRCGKYDLNTITSRAKWISLVDLYAELFDDEIDYEHKLHVDSEAEYDEEYEDLVLREC